MLAAALAATPSWAASYTVRRGDSLYRIAKLHHLGIEDLMRENSLADSTVRIGQVLRLPDAARSVNQAPSAASVSSASVSGPSTWRATPPASTPFGKVGGVVQVASLKGRRVPKRIFLGGMPFEYQTLNNCGPAALASVLGYYGVHVTQDRLAKTLRPAGGWMSAEAVAPFVRQYGLRARVVQDASVAQLKRLLAQGIPVIVVQWLERPGNVPHFRVARGYDDATGQMWVSDSMIGDAAYLSYRDFDALWTAQRHLMIPVYPAAAKDAVDQLLVPS